MKNKHFLNNKKQNKQKMKNKHFLKDCIEQFFNISHKSIIHDKIKLFDAALLVQKKHDAGGLR